MWSYYIDIYHLYENEDFVTFIVNQMHMSYLGTLSTCVIFIYKYVVFYIKKILK